MEYIYILLASHACFVNENKICYLAFSYRSTEIKIKTFCRSDIFLGLSNIQAWTENRGSGELPSSCCENNCTCTLWTPMFSMNSLQADILRHCRRFCIARIRLFVPSYTHFIGRPFRFWVFKNQMRSRFQLIQYPAFGYIHILYRQLWILWRVGAVQCCLYTFCLCKFTALRALEHSGSAVRSNLLRLFSRDYLILYTVHTYSSA